MAQEESATADPTEARIEDREVVITRTFDAPRALVFRAFTEPRHVARWWGPRGMANPVCEMDVRPGGAYRIVMRSPDGIDYPLRGVYREVVPPERIVFTADTSEHPPEWHAAMARHRGGAPAGELVMTVLFEDAGGKTRVTIRNRFESNADRDAHFEMGMREGWSLSLDRLDEVLATAEEAPGKERAAAKSGEREITASRLFDAPRELVFRVWTEPGHVARWWGPNGFRTTIREMDVRPGGAWRFVMHGPDGTDYPNQIVYVEVIPPERLVYDHVSGPTFRMTALFAEEGEKTRVSVRMLFRSREERDRTIESFHAVEGLDQTLGRLGEHLRGTR